MTREEAIKVCTRERAYVQSELDACSVNGGYVSPDGIITAADYVEAMSMAIAALREQEERSKGCDWCRSLDKKTEDFKCGDVIARGVIEHTLWGDGRWYTQEPKFCPMCGRRLEEV